MTLEGIKPATAYGSLMLEGVTSEATEDSVPRMVSLLQTQDFLLQLKTTELLTQLAITSHGHKYLETTGVMETMGVMLRDCPNLPFADVIMPGRWRIFVS